MDQSSGGMETIRISTTITAGPNRQLVARTRGHELRMDVRKERGGDDAGPTPPECMAMALGGCVMNLARIIAAENGVDPEAITITVEGDIDPSRAFGQKTSVRAGFSHLSVELELSPQLPEGKRQRIEHELMSRCPLCDTIENQTPLQLVLGSKRKII